MGHWWECCSFFQLACTPFLGGLKKAQTENWTVSTPKAPRLTICATDLCLRATSKLPCTRHLHALAHGMIQFAEAAEAGDLGKNWPGTTKLGVQILEGGNLGWQKKKPERNKEHNRFSMAHASFSLGWNPKNRGMPLGSLQEPTQKHTLKCFNRLPLERFVPRGQVLVVKTSSVPLWKQACHSGICPLQWKRSATLGRRS